MKFKIHLIIVACLIVILLNLHYFLKTNAYDFTNDDESLALTIKTYPLTFTTWEERCIGDSGEQIPCRQLQNIQTGDILVTKSSFTLFQRHGHTGFVVDAKEGWVMEATGYGDYSKLDYLERWNDYPTVQILRLKDYNPELVEAMAINAVNEYLGIPYSIFATGTHTKRTHCSALIWKIFDDFGFDLNSTGGLLVTPRDIANSDYLEIIASYGFGDDHVW